MLIYLVIYRTANSCGIIKISKKVCSRKFNRFIGFMRKHFSVNNMNFKYKMNCYQNNNKNKTNYYTKELLNCKESNQEDS